MKNDMSNENDDSTDELAPLGPTARKIDNDKRARLAIVGEIEDLVHECDLQIRQYRREIRNTLLLGIVPFSPLAIILLLAFSRPYYGGGPPTELLFILLCCTAPILFYFAWSTKTQRAMIQQLFLYKLGLKRLVIVASSQGLDGVANALITDAFPLNCNSRLP